MIRTPEQALAIARATTTNEVGMCLKWVRQYYNVGPRFASANVGWANTDFREPSWNPPPPGVPIWWTNNEFGHVAISDGDGFCISTDFPRAGVTSRVSIAYLTRAWSLTWRGASRDINEVPVVPSSYPAPTPQPQPPQEDEMKDANRVDEFFLKTIDAQKGIAHLMQKFQHYAGGGWKGPVDISAQVGPHSAVKAGSAVKAVSPRAGRIDVYFRGTDDKGYAYRWVRETRRWTEHPEGFTAGVLHGADSVDFIAWNDGG